MSLASLGQNMQVFSNVKVKLGLLTHKITIFYSISFCYSWTYETTSLLLQVSSVVLLVYGCVTVYRVTFTVSCILCFLTIPLLSAQRPNMDQPEPAGDNHDVDVDENNDDDDDMSVEEPTEDADSDSK